jgi:hypothetical protein
VDEDVSGEGTPGASTWRRIEAQHKASNREMARLWPYLMLGLAVPGLVLPVMDAVGFAFDSVGSIVLYLGGFLAVGALLGLVIRLARTRLVRQRRD